MTAAKPATVACTGEDLDEFVDAVIEANKAGISESRNVSGISESHNVSNVPNWSFGQSFFFATSLLTTVGLYTLSITDHSYAVVSVS